MVDSSRQTITWWEARALHSINLEDIDSPDFVALDKEEQVIMIAEVKGYPSNFQEKKAKEYAILRLMNYLQAAKIVIPFAMLADQKNIWIFRWNDNNLSEPVLYFKTADVLNHYDTDFSKKQIFSLYLRTLIEGWLRDLAYHWKSETPPFIKEMAEIGLWQLLEEGTTEF